MLWENHLRGKSGIGIVPINENNQCKWGAIDVDQYPLDHTVLVQKIRKLKLPLVVCRSKSGGAHCFLFCKDWIDAIDIQKALQCMSAALGYGESEIFPKQVKLHLDRGDVGNFLNLPYFNAKEGFRYAIQDDGTSARFQEFIELYDTHVQTIEQIMQIFRDTAYETSTELAVEKGEYPNFDWKGYSKSKFVKNLPKSLQEKIKKDGIRNCTLTTVAPTGSGAIVARVTSGVEPIFATSYKRRVKENDGYGKSFKEYTVYHPIIETLFGTDESLPDHVVTAHHIDPYFRVKMQGAIQKYIDSSISSTVNLAESITVETIADIYMTAYEAGLKGITVYREGSREGILITEKDDNTEEKKVTSTENSVGLALEKSPRTRPTQTAGVTRRIRTGEGTLYITINEDENGLCEVFTTIGKAGGNAAAQSEAISRLISLSLRSGLDPHAIVRQLKGISGPNPTWEDGRLILSTPDAIGKALDDYLSEKKENPSENGAILNVEKPRITLAQEQLDDKGMLICTECHNHSVVNEGGCLTCRECGWSKCD